MANRNSPLYQHPQEIWDKKTCEKAANHLAKDGLGTPYPFKGYIGSSGGFPAYSSVYGTVRYNGGCERDGQWWQGENRPLPKVADGFEIVFVRSWGWRIVKKT